LEDQSVNVAQGNIGCLFQEAHETSTVRGRNAGLVFVHILGLSFIPLHGIQNI
jgi:hypothetical protein